MNAIRDGNHIRIYDAYRIKESIKEIDGRFYDADDKAWLVPYTKENVTMIGLLGVELDDSLCEMKTKEKSVDEVPIVPMPIKVKPYQHQIRAFNFAMKMFGIGGGAA